MKAIVFGILCTGYCIKRYFDYVEHKKQYEASHAKTLEDIEKIKSQAIKHHEESLERLNRLARIEVSSTVSYTAPRSSRILNTISIPIPSLEMPALESLNSKPKQMK